MAPTTAPTSSNSGDTLRMTLASEESFRRRVVSSRSTPEPARTRCMIVPARPVGPRGPAWTRAVRPPPPACSRTSGSAASFHVMMMPSWSWTGSPRRRVEDRLEAPRHRGGGRASVTDETTSTVACTSPASPRSRVNRRSSTCSEPSESTLRTSSDQVSGAPARPGPAVGMRDEVGVSAPRASAAGTSSSGPQPRSRSSPARPARHHDRLGESVQNRGVRGHGPAGRRHRRRPAPVRHVPVRGHHPVERRHRRHVHQGDLEPSPPRLGRDDLDDDGTGHRRDLLGQSPCGLEAADVGGRHEVGGPQPGQPPEPRLARLQCALHHMPAGSRRTYPDSQASTSTRRWAATRSSSAVRRRRRTSEWALEQDFSTSAADPACWRRPRPSVVPRRSA